MSDFFRILVVCTGNICRSPAAELLLRRDLSDSGIVVESAGTRAMTGYGVTGPMARLLAERGVDSSGHTARQLDRRLIEESDLVLAMTREHRSQVASMFPPSVKRTFTLIEFGNRLKDAVPAEPGGSLVPRAREAMDIAARRAGHGSSVVDVDVVDPYRRSVAVYRRSLEQIEPALSEFTRFLRYVPAR